MSDQSEDHGLEVEEVPREAPQRWFSDLPPEMRNTIISAIDDAFDRFTSKLSDAQYRHQFTDEQITEGLRAYGAYDFVDAWTDYLEED